MASFDIDINFNLDTSGIEEAEESLASLRDTAEEMSDSVESTSSEGIEEMGASAGQTDENIKQASESMEQLGKNTDDTNQKMQETADSSSSIGTALVGVAGAIGMDAMITKADNVATSWNRLSLTFDGTGVSMDTLKTKTKQLQESTGKSGSSIRDYFNQMGIAGITNIDLLTTSFNNMSGRAYQTGATVEQMEGALQRMVMSGNAGAKMLSRLGISNTELAKAMGVSATETASAFKELTETERLDILNKAMGDGAKANEMYKESYAGLKEQADIALGGLMVAVGQSILPTVIPVMEMMGNAIKTVTNAWKSLPTPVTNVVGALGGGIVAVTTLAGAFGTLGYVGSSVVGGLKSLKNGFDSVRSAIGTARLMVQAMQSAESVSMGVRSALALATGTATTVEEANAVAKTSNIIPTQLLAIAENSLLLPVLLLVGAIIGLVAILYYLYNNNEMVRNGINYLIQSFWNFVNTIVVVAQQIYTFVINALTQVWNWVTGTTNGVNNLVSLVMSILFPFPTLIMGVLSKILPVFISQATSWITNTVSRARNLVTQVTSAIGQLPSKITSAMSGVTSILTSPFEKAYQTVKPIIDKFAEGIKLGKQLLGMDAGFDEGFDGGTTTTIQYTTINDTLNDTFSNGVQNTNITNENNFHINGIIEETASQYIVDSVTNHIKKQNLIRGA